MTASAGWVVGSNGTNATTAKIRGTANNTDTPTAASAHARLGASPATHPPIAIVVTYAHASAAIPFKIVPTTAWTRSMGFASS
jgi:hypothetical protein